MLPGLSSRPPGLRPGASGRPACCPSLLSEGCGQCCACGSCGRTRLSTIQCKGTKKNHSFPWLTVKSCFFPLMRRSSRARKARSRSASDAGFCCVSELFLLRFRAVSVVVQSCSCGVSELFLRCFRAVPAVFQNCFCGVSRLFLWWFWSVSFCGLWWCSYPMSLLSRICRLFAPILVKECKSRGSECLTMVNDALRSVK